MYNLKLASWNINGLRAALKKGLWQKTRLLTSDILCLQEIKTDDQTMQTLYNKEKSYLFESNSFLGDFNKNIEDNYLPQKYQDWLWHSAENRKGYSGVAILYSQNSSKYTFVKEKKGLGNEKFDIEGRYCHLQIQFQNLNFHLINCYYPQGGRGQFRVDYKIEFYEELIKLVRSLKKAGEKVILCGDFNTTFQDIDLARPKENRNNTGCLPEERGVLNQLLDIGLIDSFRYFYPDQKAKYTYWDQITKARERNVGWRIDFFLVDKELIGNLKSAQIYDEILGSDHCPITIELSL